MQGYPITELKLGNGWLGVQRMPGRGGAYQADLTAILQWGAGLVFSMTVFEELDRSGATHFGPDLEAAGVTWRHLPVPDFGAPPEDTQEKWIEASAKAHALLDDGGRVFVHCFGGCGRAGMALLRLMVEAGEDAGPALERLRDVRPCAVETDEQLAWASAPMYTRIWGK